MSEVKISKRRFIAGAVCPACSEPDRVQMWSEDGVPHRECVACGYADTLRQRYQVAERCRHDALRYPMLHASTAHLDAILPGTFERLKAAEPEWLWRKKTNNWIDNFPG